MGSQKKISRSQICQNYDAGGLKMIDIQLFVNALKLTWLRRLITSFSSQWAILFQLTFSSVKNILDFGSLWFKIL